MIRNRVQGLVGIALLSGCTGRVIEFNSSAGGANSIGGSTSTTGGSTALGDTGGSGPIVGCSATNLPNDPTRPGYGTPRDPQVAVLLGSMLPEEKIRQM